MLGTSEFIRVLKAHLRESENFLFLWLNPIHCGLCGQVFNLSFTGIYFSFGTDAKTTSLGLAPDWKELDKFQESLTREEFQIALDKFIVQGWSGENRGLNWKKTMRKFAK